MSSSTVKYFSDYHFRGQRDGEKILSIIHRHWFDIAVHYAVISLIVLLQFVSFFFLPFLEQWLDPRAIVPTFILANLILLTFLWFYGFLIWIDYWLDVWIVTDERVVNIEQKGLFSRHVSELHFNTVQDVTSKVQGIIPTLLNYGDVEVQTAAEKSRFLFRRVPEPYKIKAMIVERQRQAYEESIGKSPQKRSLSSAD